MLEPSVDRYQRVQVEASEQLSVALVEKELS